MRGDNFTFPRTHKTIVVGNHMPKLNAVTQAIRRRVQMVPFRAVFLATPGAGMRERLKQEALGAVLAWAIAGTVLWHKSGTAPPETVRGLTEDYLADEDGFGQWLAENCVRDVNGFERSSELHRNYQAWCEKNGARPESNAMLSRYLIGIGLSREKTMIGRCFRGITLREP
jgi:putative DNA primase/helicase